jgi:hypothetical protein
VPSAGIIAAERSDVSRAILTCATAVILLAAGCGGEEESPSEAWANDFCSAAADWRTSLDDIVGQFQSPADLNAESIQGAVDDGLEATQSFVDEVEGLGAPETEAEQEVAGIVDSMTTAVQSTAEDLRATFEGAESLQDLLAQAGTAASQVGELEQELQSSLDQLESIETGELGSELESNEDCAAARSGSEG